MLLLLCRFFFLLALVAQRGDNLAPLRLHGFELPSDKAQRPCVSPAIGGCGCLPAHKQMWLVPLRGDQRVCILGPLVQVSRENQAFHLFIQASRVSMGEKAPLHYLIIRFVSGRLDGFHHLGARELAHLRQSRLRPKRMPPPRGISRAKKLQKLMTGGRKYVRCTEFGCHTRLVQQQQQQQQQKYAHLTPMRPPRPVIQVQHQVLQNNSYNTILYLYRCILWRRCLFWKQRKQA